VSTVPDVTVTIPVPVSDKAVASAAMDVFAERIRHLGYGTFSSGIGDVMSFSLPGDPPPDVAQIRAALAAHGSLSFLPLPADSEVPSTGDAPPAGIQPLFEPAGSVASASVVDQGGTPALEIVLAPEAAAAFADHSKAHVGDYLAMVLDGTVLAAPMLQSEIPDGDVVISFPTDGSAPFDLDVIAAVLSSGPLPPEWP
jgi:hypothetical protein